MPPSKTISELKHHAPFTFLATLLAIILVAIIKIPLNKEIPESLFHIMHPAHLFVSAIVTSAIYFRYKKNIINAILIGLAGSILIGTISDIIFPWLGGIALGLNTSFHFPLVEMPFIIIATALIGSLIGLLKKTTTKIPHFIHVFLSVFASLFYLTSFTANLNTIFFILSIIIVFIAVLIPCCLSDIIFPLIFVKNNRIKTSFF